MKWLFFLFFNALCGMSLQDKVGQVFLAPIYEWELTEHGREFLEKTRLGNIIYFSFANGPFAKEPLAKLSADLNQTIVENCGIAPLIAIDQEGKGFNQLNFLDQEIGKGLKELGITVDLAPVVDIVVRPDCPLKYRSYGSDPEVVADAALQMIRGLHESGIKAVLKHFPGLGDTVVDSHIGLPVLNKTVEELEALELKPYFALKEEADAVMIAHVLCSAIDPVRPASLSPACMQLLRERVGFEKVIMTDSLVMKGVLGEADTFAEAVSCLTRASIDAFLAGADLLLLAQLEWVNFPVTREQNEAMIAEVMEGFLQAVERGEISEERLEASLRRIWKMKGFQ